MFRHLVEAVPQLIWVTDAAGCVEYVNRPYIEYTGYALEDLCGMTAWRKALHPDDLERCLRDWQTAIETSSGFETEYRLRRASDATWRWHLTRALPIEDEAGRVVKWVGTCTDIEEQKRIQESLRVSEERIAEESRRKDEFLAMLGHELRNPLAPILGAVQLLKGRDRGGHELDIIERQARHMARLVDDLLDVARITSGRIQLRRERVELATVIDRALEIAMPLVDARRHTLVVEVPRDGMVVDADPDRLAQVIANLVNNAAKYTDREGIVTVRAARAGDEVTVSVTDTGIGIAPDQLPHVFDLFVQGERALDRAQGGLGIGLTVVRRLVELHGGRASAASELGRGSEFAITLPCAQPRVPSVLGAPPADAAAPCLRRILVVDDNADIVEIVQDYLTWKGFDVHVAFDGASALDVARATQPEVVLLDIGLPAMNGYEVARRLRSDETLAHTRLIALTGYGQQSDRECAWRSGFDDHLVKPLDLERLVGILRAPAPHPRVARSLG